MQLQERPRPRLLSFINCLYYASEMPLLSVANTHTHTIRINSNRHGIFYAIENGKSLENAFDASKHIAQNSKLWVMGMIY